MKNCKIKISNDLKSKYVRESFIMVRFGLPRPNFNEWLALRSTGILTDKNFK